MHRSTLFNILAVVSILVPGMASGAETASDWTQWRGPGGTGHAPNANPPAEWTETKNIRWKVAVPGAGHSSPIVLGDRVYLMTAVETDQVVEGAGDDRGERSGRQGRGARGMRVEQPTHVHAFMVLALDRSDGSVAWSTTVREQVPHEGTHGTGSFASGSPVTDGEHIFAFFGSRGLYCLSMDGTIVWGKDLGDMQTRRSFGEGASPALHGSTLVVPWDHEGASFVAAFDKNTGAERWRVDRDEATTWTTPVIVEARGTRQAVVAGTNATVSYDLATGKEVWRCSGMTVNVIPTPVVGHGMIYLTSGFRGSALQAIKLDESEGDISGSDAIAWSIDRGTPYVPSPMLSGRNLYFLRSNSGVISCVDAVTGAAHYTGERLDGIQSVYSSLVGAGGRIYVCGREGEIVVLADGPELKTLATNSVGEGIDATPAIVGGELYLRGSDHLFCIAESGAGEPSKPNGDPPPGSGDR